MKNLLCLLIAVIISMPACAGEISALSREEIPVFLNGTEVIFNTAPVLSEGRIIVPVREISEALGASVSWDGETKTAGITFGKTEVSFTIGKNVMYLNGEKTSIDAVAAIINDRTFVPLRALAEALGIDVLWEDETKRVYLSSNNNREDYIIAPTYYVASGEYEGCVIACKAMVLSNHFDKLFTFEEVLEMNGGGVYANWAPEYCNDVTWQIVMESELELKQEVEDWTESAFTPAEKFEMICTALQDSSGIIAQFSDGTKSHGVVITGYTAGGEIIVCDPDTKSDNPENTLFSDSCLAKMFDLYTTEEILPYLISMRMTTK